MRAFTFSPAWATLRPMRLHPLALAVVLLAVPALAQEPAADAGAAPAAAAPAAPTAAEFSAKLDELWKTRDAAESMKASDAAISAGLKAFPEDYELLWRAARYRWWVADGASDKLQRQLSKEGWNYAERALKVKPNGPEGRYYLALSIGAYSQAVGVLKALSEGLEGKFVDNLDFAMKNNEAFDRHGAHTAKGRYWWELPWPKRDLEKSKDELNKSIAKSPEHLRNYLFLAETLLKDGKAKEAKVEIDKVLNGSGDYDPPEARRVKGWAKPVAEQIKKELD